MLTKNQSQNSFGIQEMSADEIDLVGGAGPKVSGSMAIGAAAGIGAAAFGSSWGAMGVAAAFAAAPVAVAGMAVLVGWGAYTLWNQK